MIVEMGVRLKGDGTRLTFHLFVSCNFHDIRHLFLQVLTHTVSPTVPLRRIRKVAALKGADKLIRVVLCLRRVTETHMGV